MSSVKKHQFTQMYLKALTDAVPGCLREIMQDPTRDKDMEFGDIIGRKHEWHTRFALNKVTRLFVLLLENEDEERYLFFTFGSPIAALKYVGLVEYRPNEAFNCESGEFEPLFDDLIAVVKTFSRADSLEHDTSKQ